MSNRAINLIYKTVKNRLNITADEFAEALNGWEFVELEHQSKLFGVIMIKENELHISLDGIPKFSIRKHLKNTIGQVIKNYGFAITTVSKGNEKGLSFCKRMGFVITNEDSTKIHMKCDRCKYVR